MHSNTRLSKVDDPNGPFAAIVLAAAGLIRVNLSHRISSFIDAPTLLYAVGQGALGIEVRSNDPRVQSMVAKLDHWQTSWRCKAEREMLRVLEGGCSVPVGCQTTLEELPTSSADHDSNQPRSANLKLYACITSLSGDRSIETTITKRVNSPAEAEFLGQQVAHELVAKGGREILEELGRKVEDDAFALRHEAAVKKALERAAYSPEAAGGLSAVIEAQCGHAQVGPDGTELNRRGSRGSAAALSVSPPRKAI